jgi:TerC family integral membrane protein
VIRLAHRFFPITSELHGQKLVVRRDELRQDEAVQPPGEDEPECGPAKDPSGAGDPDCPPGQERVARQQAAPDVTPAAPAKPRGPEVVRGNTAWVLTPLALALIVVEGTDLVFAVDSIPAIFAITGDAFLVFTSNVFAILGLRSLYFALAGIIDKFYYLKTALAVVLGLVGVKMPVADFLKKLPLFEGNRLSFFTLGMVALILGVGVVASILRARRVPVGAHAVPPAGDGESGGTSAGGAGTPREARV